MKGHTMSLKHRTLLFFLKYLAFIFLSLLNLTFRYEVHGLKKPYRKAIYVFWHQNIISLLLNRKREQVAVIISSSKDGDYIAEPAKLFGYIPVRGSSTRQGANALKELVALTKHHSVAITPDGPKGPAFEFKNGALQVALLSGLPIIAVKVFVSSAWSFASWDSFIFPHPFAKIKICYSEPFVINSKDDFKPMCTKIESWMNNNPEITQNNPCNP